MEQGTVQTAVAVVVPLVGALAWLMSLHGRVNSHDREIHDVKGDIRYIRDRVDDAINGRGHGV